MAAFFYCFMFVFSLTGGRFWWKQDRRGMTALWVAAAVFSWALLLYA
jgi:hypothetical protein